MNISDLTIENLLAIYGAILILAGIIKIVYFISLHSAISKNRHEIKETNKILREQTERQIDLLERIANALEQDQEPYIIESDKENK